MNINQINQLQKAMRVLRDVYPDMSLNMAMTFLEVAKGNGTHTTDIEKAIGITQSAASRNLRFFDKFQSAQKAGQDLFTMSTSTDLRTKVRHLNPKGKEVLERISAIYQ
jgi:DNA-binding MarR family transcriptional regulator